MKFTFKRLTFAIIWFLVWVMITLPVVHADEYETIRETLETCATCHGDMTQATVAQRVVDHTMSFCVDCHNQRQASVECLTCHN